MKVTITDDKLEAEVRFLDMKRKIYKKREQQVSNSENSLWKRILSIDYLVRRYNSWKSPKLTS